MRKLLLFKRIFNIILLGGILIMAMQKEMKIGLSNQDKQNMANEVRTEVVDELIDPFSTSTAYSVGDFVAYNGNIYKFTADKSAGVWDASKVVQANLNDYMDTVNDKLDEQDDDISDFKDEINNDFDEFKGTVNTKISNQDATIAGLGQLHPAGVDTTTNIQAKTTDQGIWISSTDGHWYYYNANATPKYVDGGVYMTTTQFIYLADNTDLNTITTTSYYYLKDSRTYINTPFGMKTGILITYKLENGLIEQIFYRFGQPQIYIRWNLSNVWRSWVSSTTFRNLEDNADLNDLISNGETIGLLSNYSFEHNPFPDRAVLVFTFENYRAYGTGVHWISQIAIESSGQNIAIRNNINNNGYGAWNYLIKNDNHWSGKTWYAYGTSITSTAQGKYVPYLAQMSGMTAVNKGIPGGGIGNLGAYSQGQVYNAVCNITDGKLNADLISLECGANDVDANVPLGTIYDTGQSTLCGCFNDCIRYLQVNTNAQIVVIPSIPSKNEPNALNKYYEFQMMMKQMCFINRVEFIEGNDALGYARINGNTTYTADTIHQTNLGGYNLAKSIWAKLKDVPLFYTAIPE